MTQEPISPLALAVENFDVVEAERLLKSGASPNEMIRGHLPIIQLAVDVEADSYVQRRLSDRGDAPPSGRFVELFLEAGADPYVVDPETGWDTFDAAFGGIESQPYHPGALEMLAKHGYKRRERPGAKRRGIYQPLDGLS